MNLLGLTCDELTEMFRRRYGRGLFHAAAVYRAFYRDPCFDIGKLPEFAASGGLAEEVGADLSIRLPEVVRQETCERTTKLVLRLADGLEIESVVVPMANHTSLCLSSQAGCRMGCRFCRTGQMGFQRNLRADEIVAQVYAVKVLMGLNVRNVVFMGMGEPLDNFDALIRAIRILEDQRGLNIAKRHMTVSTVGLVEGIRKLAAQNWPQLKLAVSLNAPNDDVRNRLMPINHRFPLSQLKSVLQDYPLARGNALFFEYVLIKGQNDQPAHAGQLSAYLKGLPAKLNLILFNPGPNLPYLAPTPEDVARFHCALVAEGVFVRLRSAKGADIRAACGQLGRANI
ncbi:MAG: 23S rRNA (adenine(2503)-C(2))-methyltransferase RlmN [Desulfobacterales bacterium]|jgi:23S rRNA (adenine2503-C2)-methyltransferase|nr:23S rRNA (adenine(2503)-C(2))-methyltransferase RlmN [Desulfobacterales bacterium]